MTASTLTAPQSTVIDFEAFRTLLQDELGCDLVGRSPDVRLVEDLGWDSLAFFELLALFDRYALDVPDHLASALRTLADAHHYFVQLGIATDHGRPALGRGPTQHMPTQRDFDYLLELHAAGEHLVRYRLRGVTPSPDSFHRLLWEGVTAQFVVRSETGSAVGLVSCFGADFRNRHAHIGVLGDPAWHHSGLLIAGAWRFIGDLFSEFDLRKLYAEVLESNFEHLATGAGRLFEVEGRLSWHEYIDGDYQDLFVLALDRDRWREQEHRMTWSPSG